MGHEGLLSLGVDVAVHTEPEGPHPFKIPQPRPPSPVHNLPRQYTYGYRSRNAERLKVQLPVGADQPFAAPFSLPSAFAVQVYIRTLPSL